MATTVGGTTDYIVQGQVRDAGGRTLSGVVVRAVDKDLRREEPLGETLTDGDGRYQIHYTDGQFRHAEKGTADLIVRVLDTAGAELVESPILFNAPIVATVDLMVGGAQYHGQSEYERLMAAIAPVLDDVALADLTEDAAHGDITFLAGETGEDPQHIAYLVIAARLQGQTDVAAEAFYGFARENLPVDLPSLLARSTEELRQALEAAIAENIIPLAVRDLIDRILTQLRDLLVRAVLQPPSPTAVKTSLGALLSTAQIPPDKQAQFVNMYLSHSGAIEDFWQTLRGNDAFKGQVENLQLALQLGALTDNHLPLVGELQRLRAAGTIASLRDLAQFDENDWQQIITGKRDGAVVGAPPDVPGRDDAEKAANYAKVLTRIVEDAFPTAVITQRVQKDGVAGKEDLGTFFANSPGFELGTLPVRSYIAQNPQAVQGVRDTQSLVTNLTSMERVYKLTPRYAEMQALRAAGLDSAQAVIRMGRTAFVHLYGSALGGTDRAITIHENALQVAATALHLVANYSTRFDRTALSVLPDGQGKRVVQTERLVMAEEAPQVANLPDLQVLFGSLDMCDCGDCRSVLSPAAYLTDILHFLKDKPATTAKKSAKDVLFARRPDLGRILLNCVNTNTLVPYVDLVNEVLENAVSPFQDDKGAQIWPQTTGTAEELSANPQYLNAAAYDVLRQAVYPWDMPFDLWWEEARAYLAHLGIQRHELMETFQQRGGKPDPSDVAIAGEYLGLTTIEREIVSGATVGGGYGPGDFWGYADKGWIDNLKSVKTMLGRSGLSFEDLTAILQTRFVNPGGSVAIQPATGADPATCDIEKLEIVNLTDAVLDRFHRFVRLQRRLAWTIPELDLVLSMLTSNVSEENDSSADSFIRRLSTVQWLCTQLGLPVEQILALWIPINTIGESPLYRTLFQNEAVLKPVDPAFKLSGTGSELEIVTANPPDARISKHASTILAALGINAADLGILSASETPGNELTLANLSRLYRVTLLAKSLNLTIADTITLRALTGINPFDKGQMEDTRRFVEVVTAVRRSGFSVAELDYLLRHRFVAASGIAPDENRIGSVLADIRSGLQKVAPESLLTLGASLVAQKLGEALNVNAKTADQLLSHWVHAPVHPGQPAISEFLAPAFIASDPQKPPAAADFPDQFEAFALLHKVAMLVTRFKISPGPLLWLFVYGPAVGWLDPGLLPLASIDSGATLFSGWLRLVDLFQLRDQLPSGETVLSTVFAGARDSKPDEAALLRALSDGTGWSLDDLTFLVGIDGLALTFPDAFKDERALRQLQACFSMLKRLGASASQARAWTKPDLQFKDGRGIKEAAKAKYDNAAWLTVAGPLRDPLRERQRAALTAYLVDHPPQGQSWRDSNDLYEYYLIDVEMGACMKTSRIKQAIGSVQQFVQQCLMNRETEVVANAEVNDGWRWWSWMKYYRVWEANREIFLFPENWIEPELRSDKSPFFKDLESELLQNDVTPDTAEAALLHYLEKLDTVANLEICGLYRQEDGKAGGTENLHVFGRTRGTPHIYYYRRRIGSATWTPWEKVSVDIEGDYLIPIVSNNRLYLFWPIFTETAKDTAMTMPGAGKSMAPSKYWKIQMAWSEYRGKKWSAKKVSEKFIQYPDPGDPDSAVTDLGTPSDINTITFRQVPDDGTIKIRFYSYKTNAVQPLGEYSLAGCYADMSVQTWHIDDPKHRQELLTGHSISTYPDPRINTMMWDVGAWDFKLQSASVLAHTLGGYQLLGPDYGVTFDNTQPFFYEEYADKPDPRSFLVDPEVVHAPAMMLGNGDQASPSLIDEVHHGYYVQRAPLPGPTGLLQGESDAAVIQGASGAMEADVSGHAGAVLSAGAAATGNGRTALPARSQGAVSNLLQQSPEGSAEYTLPRNRDTTLYRFQPSYHPYVCDFVATLNRDGLDGLLQRSTQVDLHEDFFQSTYAPTQVVEQPYPRDEVDFARRGLYSGYNWELFFHAPLLIAARLSRNQRFEDAQRWFHYIFDPTDTSNEAVPQRYWRTGWFFSTSASDYQREEIGRLLDLLAAGNSDPDLTAQIEEWRNHPFDPHVIARIRTTAYQKTVVMKYLDNLVAWGDQLFLRNTLESINEATQLYVLAAMILGPRPEVIPPRTAARDQAYVDLEPKLDQFSDALVQAESLVPKPKGGALPPGDVPPLTLPTMLYFCVPRNDKLLGYWDTVADRLFKIRHCMNIEGVAQQLPLFEPPIDPALLVRAAAAGVDIGSVLGDVSATVPHYRFTVMAQKAAELCAEVKALGGALLSALEKRDAEALGLLRSRHEIRVLEAMRDIKQMQVDEATRTLEGLNKSRELAKLRSDYYTKIAFMNPSESAHLEALQTGLTLQAAQGEMEMVANALFAIPDTKVGAPTTMGSTIGGSLLGNMIKAFSAQIGVMAGINSTTGSMMATLGGYHRRADEWDLQKRSANKEMEQIDKQIAASQLRLQIAAHELQNHDLQIANAHEVDDFLHDKYTDQDLYDWMVGQISGVYFQSYQMAYDTAKKAERAYAYELRGPDPSFIQFGYWDSLKKGLLAGEQLAYDLKRMEMAYLDRNSRELEITKEVSIALLDPIELVRLKQTGACRVTLPESLFDLDYPGHYMRRIKSVSLTIPCVTGPYTSVNCTLTLQDSRIRTSKSPANPYPESENPPDPRFVYEHAPQSIATSHAQNDSGLFELTFRDDRYLPFEGAGAVSTWYIELDPDSNFFDFDTIVDVILRLRYTARDGGKDLKTGAKGSLPKTGARLFSAEKEFPTDWYRFLHPADPKASTSLHLDLGQGRFPFQLQGKSITFSRLDLVLKLKDGATLSGSAPAVTLTTPGPTPASVNGSFTGDLTVLNGKPPVQLGVVTGPGDWLLTTTLGALATQIDDLFIICSYTTGPPSEQATSFSFILL